MQDIGSVFDTNPLDFDIPSSSLSEVPAPVSQPNPYPPAPVSQPNPYPPAPKQQPDTKPPANINIKPQPKVPTVHSKNIGFSNLPELPSVPTDIPSGVINENKNDEDFDDLLNRFEDLKKNKKNTK